MWSKKKKIISIDNKRKTLQRKKLKDVNIETDYKFEMLKRKDLQDVKQDTNNGINLDKKTFQLKKNVQIMQHK